MPKHKSTTNVHRHERPPLHNIQSTVVSCRSLPHSADSMLGNLLDSIMPMLQQKRATKRSRHQSPPSSVLFRIRHREDAIPIGTGSEGMIPFCFAKAATNTVDGGKALEVADGDFVG